MEPERQGDARVARLVMRRGHQVMGIGGGMAGWDGNSDHAGARLACRDGKGKLLPQTPATLVRIYFTLSALAWALPQSDATDPSLGASPAQGEPLSLALEHPWLLDAEERTDGLFMRLTAGSRTVVTKPRSRGQQRRREPFGQSSHRP
jgi:hypothetical protein